MPAFLKVAPLTPGRFTFPLRTKTTTILAETPSENVQVALGREVHFYRRNRSCDFSNLNIFLKF